MRFQQYFSITNNTNADSNLCQQSFVTFIVIIYDAVLDLKLPKQDLFLALMDFNMLITRISHTNGF